MLPDWTVFRAIGLLLYEWAGEIVKVGNIVTIWATFCTIWAVLPPVSMNEADRAIISLTSNYNLKQLVD